MKKLLFTLLTLISCIIAYGQGVNLISDKDIPLSTKEVMTINLPKADAQHKTITVLFRLTGIEKKQSVTFKATDTDEGSASKGVDYQYINGTEGTPLSITGVTTKVISIDITPTLTNTKKTNAMLTININSSGKFDKSYIVKLNFNTDADLVLADQSSILALPDTSKWNLRIVTGGNFDFFNGPEIKNFAGEINAFVPCIFKPHFWDRSSLGLQFGLFNYHYSQSDSSGLYTNRDYYYLNPSDYYKTLDSTKIVRRESSLKRKVDYNIWGAYIDPMIRIANNEFAQLYLSAHFEALITTETYNPTFNSLYKDTILYYPKKSPIIDGVTPHPRNFATYIQNKYYDFYYGIGFPLKINMNKQFLMSIAPSFGCATIQQSSSPSGLDFYDRFSNGKITMQKAFFLTKFQIVTNVAPVDIAIGGEFRDVIGQMHYLTTYIGATLTLDKLKR